LETHGLVIVVVVAVVVEVVVVWSVTEVEYVSELDGYHCQLGYYFGYLVW
jgi:hypothetical protein